MAGSLYNNIMPTLVQPLSSGATVSEDIDGTRILVPGRWSWNLFFVAFWLCGWTVGGVAAGRSLLHSFNLFLCFWMLGWIFGECFAGYTVLYALAGRQVIVASSETLTCRTEILGLGWGQSYLAREIRNLRFQPAQVTSRGRLPSKIAFDYGSQTVRFATGLQAAEAADLINRIRQRWGIAALAATVGSGI